MDTLIKTRQIKYAPLIMLVLLAQLQFAKAQNYMPLQLDSLQFFKGIPFESPSLLMYAPKNSMYKVIYIDSLEQQINYEVYKNITTTRDTSTSFNASCLDVYGGSWLGNKIIKDNNQRIVFLNNNNDSIFFKYNSPVGTSWLLYQYNDNSKIIGTINSLQTGSIYGLIDSTKHITLQFFDQNNQMSSHPLNNKTIILSKNYGAISLPNFYYFPIDTNFLSRRFNMEMVTSGQIYDFNIGDVFCYSNQIYDLNGGTNIPPNKFVYHIQSKFYTQGSQVINYGRWIQSYKTIVNPGVGLQTLYNSYYDTLAIDNNITYPLPEITTLPVIYNLLGTTLDSTNLGVYSGLNLKTYSNLAFETGNCYQMNNFEPAPHIDVFGIGFGLIERDSMLAITGSNVLERRIRLIGYIKNGQQFGEITSIKELENFHYNFFNIISINNAQLIMNYNAELPGTLSIDNALGQNVFQYNYLKFGANSISIPPMAKGIYFISVNNTMQMTSRKILIGQ